MSTEITTTSESQPKRKAKASKKTKATSSKKTTKSAKAKTANKPKDTKKQRVLELLRRNEGATIAELAKATDWQNHSIRGFLSGTLTKKMGLKVESEKHEAGERTYRIAE
jgi:hypothetical protein